MSAVSYDSEGRRLGAEVAAVYHAWCEGCGWRGPDRNTPLAAQRDQEAHDADVHAV